MEHSLTRPSKVVRTESLGCDNFRLTVMAPQIAEEARPGQFVMVQTAPGQDPLLRRPFSIHQVSGNGTIQILFKVVGRGTRILSETREGESLSVFGPLGKAFTLDGKNKNICMIGGGMGIAPSSSSASGCCGQDSTASWRPCWEHETRRRLIHSGKTLSTSASLLPSPPTTAAPVTMDWSPN